MPKYEVFVLCPVHKKPVSLVVEAVSPGKAKEKVMGKVIHCPYYPPHNFVVGFREGEAEILGVRVYPWAPPPTGVVSVAKAPPIEVKPVAPKLMEKVYYVDRKIAHERLGKMYWWEKPKVKPT